MDQIVIFSGIAFLLVLAYMTIRALIIPLFLAFVLGYAFKPFYNSVLKVVRVRSISAFIIILALIALTIIPLTFLAPSLVRQTFDLYIKIQNLNIGSSLNSLLLSTTSPEVVQAINLQLNNILARLFSSLMNSFSSFLTNLPIKLMYLAIFFFIFYFVLIDFDKIWKSFSDFMPLSSESKKKFASEFRNVTDGILYGQILIGILQGVLLGFLLFIFGIPGALLFTIIAIVAGILPMVGPTLVWIPISIYLIFTGSPLRAVVLALWGLIISGVSDGLLRPFILSRKTMLPIAWGFVSTIGGLFAFGLVGLLVGPLIMAYLIIVIQFYKQGKFNELFKL